LLILPEVIMRSIDLLHRATVFDAGLVVLFSLLLAGCGGGGADVTVPPFSVINVTGKWSVYRTYTGQPERGPDLAEWSNSGTGYGIKMHLPCSTYVLPNGWVDIAGEIHDDNISLSIGTSSNWSGTISGDNMSGTFTDINGSGTWRAAKTQSSQCITYEVYGGNAYLPCGGTQGYDPSKYGYTFLGTATSTATFNGSYSYYTIVTRDFNVIHLDTVQGSNGAYFGTTSTGNTTGYVNIGGVPDGLYATVGANRMSGGGYVDIDASAATLSSITVNITP
jgi:hypothetical protein